MTRQYIGEMDICTDNIPNPKRRHYNGEVWYSYYAGYTEDFVESIISSQITPNKARILDPWNGSGTTTHVAARLGSLATGIDANPALCVVAKGRSASLEPTIRLRDNLVFRPPHSHERGTDLSDPLLNWLKPDAVGYFRSLQSQIDPTANNPRIQTQRWNALATLTPEYCVAYVALFESLRDVLEPYRTSNPAWLKLSTKKDVLDTTPTQICERFEHNLDQKIGYLIKRGRPSSSPVPRILNRDFPRGTRLQRQFDGIVTSPPYCTRIDYVMATAPELALLLHIAPGQQAFDDKRRAMLGTNLTSHTCTAQDSVPASPYRDLLEKIKGHSSKASSSYYFKFYNQYFNKLNTSIKRISTLTSTTGYICVVVQDSYYKDIHINLPEIVTSLFSLNGWKLELHKDFQVTTNLANSHPSVRNYRDRIAAKETALLFRWNEV